MNLKKRGLGRGLEALLAETPGKDESESRQIIDEIQSAVADEKLQQANVAIAEDIGGAQSSEILKQPAMAISLIKNIQRENLLLQEEAVAFMTLLEEFEQMLKRS
ncbi:MAG: hypothetical protein ABL925_12060 [Methylococcales bacterium]